MVFEKKQMQGFYWLAFVGLTLVGLGVGMLYDNTTAGILIGMGAGFLSVVALYILKS